MLQVVFDKEIYRPGDTLKAYITLNLPSRLEVDYGVLNLKYVFRSREGDNLFRKTYIDEDISFMDPGTYPAGVYNYNLSYQIPRNVPPSFRGRILEGLLKYTCIIRGGGGFTLSRNGQLLITHAAEDRSEETIYGVTSGEIHINLIMDRPVKGRILRGVLTIEEGKELVRRIGLDLCIYEGYASQKLLIFKDFRETSRCIPIHKIVVSRGDIARYPFRADLGRLLGGRIIYTAPYSDPDMRFQTYLRIKLSTREGDRTYYQPLQWYPFEEADKTYVEKEVMTMEERIRRAIIEYFQTNIEGDIIDVQEYLDVKGFNVNIHMLERLFRILKEEGLIREVDNNPVLKRYRINP